MSNELIIIAALNILLGYFCWYYLFRRYFIDSHRHELFKLRYKLFDFALKNNISFEHEAFKMRWNEINSMIRFTHETHLMLISGIFNSKKFTAELDDYNKKREEILNSLTPDQKKFFETSRNEQVKLFFSYIIKSSLIFLFISIILVVLIALIGFLFLIWERTNFINKIKPRIDEVYDEYEYLSLNTT